MMATQATNATGTQFGGGVSKKPTRQALQLKDPEAFKHYSTTAHKLTSSFEASAPCLDWREGPAREAWRGQEETPLSQAGERWLGSPGPQLLPGL